VAIFSRGFILPQSCNDFVVTIYFATQFFVTGCGGGKAARTGKPMWAAGVNFPILRLIVKLCPRGIRSAGADPFLLTLS
jgi:hypothetical protein